VKTRLASSRPRGFGPSFRTRLPDVLASSGQAAALSDFQHRRLAPDSLAALRSAADQADSRPHKETR
jgi:hypothetical protein